MKTLSAPVQQAVDGDVNTLGWRLKITPTDGDVVAIVTHDLPVTIDGTPHLATPGFDVSSFVNAAGLAVGNNELTVLAENGVLELLDVLAGKYDGAAYEIDQYDFDAAAANGGVVAAADLIRWPHGRIGNVKPKYGAAVVELRDHRQALQGDTTRIHAELCPYTLGVNDGRLSFCPVNAATYTTAFEVTAIDEAQRVFRFDLDVAEDYYGLGLIDWTGGDNAGRQSKVIEQTGNRLTLAEPLVHALQVGDTGTILAGDRKRLEDCRDKFGALLDFGGDPDAPTTGQLATGQPSERPASIGAPTPAPPASSPSPSPAPPPSAPLARPLIVALDYTQTSDAANIALHAKADLSIRGWSTAKAASIGTSWPNAVQAVNADHLLAQYVILNELADDTTASDDLHTARLEVDARDWWVYSEPAHTKVQWTSAFDKWEVNPTTATTANGSGQRWPQYKAAWDFDNRIDNIPDCTIVFLDNARAKPLVAAADYDRDGTNETNTAAAGAWRAGLTAYVTALKAQRVGLQVIANVNHDCSEFADDTFDYAFHEGMVGRSYGSFTTAGGGAAGVLAVRERLIESASHVTEQAILHAYVETGTYALARMGYGLAAMFDAGYCLTDSTPSLTFWHLDEFYVALGSRVDSMPTAAAENGVWACEFENALVLVNPEGASGTIDVTALGAGAWKRLDATDYDSQDTTTNSGANVTSVTLAARSGLVLVPQ